MKAYNTKPVLTRAVVMEMLQAACDEAQSMGIAVNVAVTDDGGNLCGFVRMDGAPLLSVEIAQNKAYTASAFGIPTREWYSRIKDDPALLHGIVHTPRLTIFAGGLPLRIHGQLVGGVGVSGGSGDQDEACARRAVSEFERWVNQES
ncbi:MAG: heme-binding protein [Alicyclobacillus herbarius]|uniref:GlcG/HbpS family heme-binding protein n=1 Tax=Alicyclobacillus herbarius TaxID=122960 RepID=UPI0023528914|nr:heme-binding protein [Alicyclobacillus herbarius]MCL6631824.1 heme-binding protein [Alicyclobacillus herbarius]